MSAWSTQTDWSTPRTAPAALRRPQSSRLRERAFERSSPVRRTDWVLLVAVFGLCAIGVLLVWSATRPYNLSLHLDPNAFLKKDLLNIGLGVALGSAVALIDYRTLRVYAPVLFVLSCVGLVAVLSPLGTRVNGAHSWISVGGGFEVQPSEFAKLALIVVMAMILAERRDIEEGPSDGDVLLVLGLAVVPMLLILKEPDLGMVLVLIFVILGVIGVSGARTRWVVGLLVLGVVAAVAGTHLHLLKHYQVQRLTSFANPHAGTGSFGYNTQQARIAVGSGGLFGEGLFHGTQTNGHFVPEQQTDFVFTVAGEELGFVGSAAVILLTGVVLWRALRIAGLASDAFGTLLATGVACWFAFQAFENIGMTLGITPVTGLPLPFVSYGGSSMFVSMMAIGLLQNVHVRSRE